VGDVLKAVRIVGRVRACTGCKSAGSSSLLLRTGDVGAGSSVGTGISVGELATVA
jgi:hypothetical protein